MCERVSKLLLEVCPTIANNFVDLWTSDDLANVPGIILYKQLEPDLEMSTLPRMERGGSQKIGLHARTVGRYLCQDGKPIATSPLYEGAGPAASVTTSSRTGITGFTGVVFLLIKPTKEMV